MAPVNRWLRPENLDVVQRSIKICHVIPKVYCARYQAVPEGSPVQYPHRIIIPIWGDFLTIIKVYPLFVAVGTVVGICVMQLVRNITTNPDVRVLKEKRTAGVLDNLAEGQKYKEHGLRKYVRNKKPQIMPSVNDFFSKPE